MSAHETLGLLLVREALITRPQLYDALRLQRQTGRLLGTCLLSLGHVKPEALLAMLARQLSIPALPPGTLSRASPEAVRRVPREVAWRLRILPYSWDGQMIGVAVSDGRVLSHLHEVAYHARAAVGAYVALETEIEAVLRSVYPETLATGAPPDAALGTERPRPPRTLPAEPVSARELGPTAPRAAAATAPEAAGRSPLGPEAAAGAPPAERLERVGFFEAVERLYEEPSVPGIGCMVGRALLNYFQRVLVIQREGQRFEVAGCAGVEVQRTAVPQSSLPLTVAKLAERQITYGRTVMEVRAAELAAVFGFEPGATALIASVGADLVPSLLVLADNGGGGDLYEDLHDVELLLKEAETGLAMLLDRRSPGEGAARG